MKGNLFMRKIVSIFVIISIIACAIIFTIIKYDIKTEYYINLGIKYIKNIKGVKVPEEYSKVDRNNNGTADPLDIVSAARKEVENKTAYKDAYYSGGYPPETEGVCTDVIWRGFKGIGIDFKAMVDKDIKSNTSAYLRVNGKPDPNIDFRRVKNLDVFFRRNAEEVIKELIPYDSENLKQWQPGDIVIIMKPFEHIAVISDKRDKNGVPKVIHNTTPHAIENGSLTHWAPYIYRHYRWKY
jgi:uncharacterized protein YijF (DUF1287 family)